MAAQTLVVDLSHHNPDPNWTQLKNAGIVGVILKASEGQTYVDKTFKQRRQAALSAGLKVNSYHFFHGKAEAEMAHYLATIQPVQGERVAIDHEAEATLDQLVQAVKYLRATRPDLQITIYSGHTIREQLGNTKNDYLAQNTSLWIAHYTTAVSPSWPKATWPAWSLWQYTDKFAVAGISAPVDGNRWNGSKENLARWMGPDEPPPSEPEPEVPTIEITISASASVKVVINGESITV